MRKLLVAAAVISSLVVPATAEDKMVVDMSKMTCGELMSGAERALGIKMPRPR